MEYPDYRTPRWWIHAVVTHSDLLIRNFLYRLKYIFQKRSFEEITPEEIMREKSFSRAILCGLNHKYNEFQWIDKYIECGMHLTIPEFLMASLWFNMNHYTCWSHTFTIKDCKKALEHKFPFTTSIRLKNGNKHMIVMHGYNVATKRFMTWDPLGDYFSEYKIWYGNTHFYEDQFLKIATGNPISAYFSFSDISELKRFKEIFPSIEYSYP